MQQCQIPSFRQLADRAEVSLWQVQQLRWGNIEQMRIAPLSRLATALEVNLVELLAKAGIPLSPLVRQSSSEVDRTLAALQAECQHLQKTLQEQEQDLRQQFQREALHQLEPWLKNWPKVIHATTHGKPDLLATKILPLLHPLDQMLQDWGVESIGHIGEVLPYDPQVHQLRGSLPQGGERVLVEVQCPGYRHGEIVLHRAEVKVLPC